MIENIIQTENGYRATIDGVEMFVPFAEGNRHYRMVQDAIAEGATVTPYTPPAPPVPKLTFPQLLYGLVIEQWITQEEADAWLVSRTLPAAVDALIAALSPAEQILAKARALQPTEVIFADPMVQAMAQSQGKTPDEMAAFFTTYAGV